MLAASRKKHPSLHAGKCRALVRHILRMDFLRARRLLFIVIGIMPFTLIASQQVLDASTSRSGASSDYLTWLLRNEEPISDAAPVAGSVTVASLPKEVMVRSFIPSDRRIEQPSTQPPVAIEDPRLRHLVQIEPTPRRLEFSGSRTVIERVRNGDTLSSIMQRYGVSLKTSLAMVWAAHQVFNHRGKSGLAQQFQPGKLIKLTFDQEDHIISLDYPVDDARTLHVFRGATGVFSAEMRKMSLGATAKRPSSAEFPIIAAKKRDIRGVRADKGNSGFFAHAARRVQDTIRQGDLLTSLLARHGISKTTAFQVAVGSKPVFDLARLMRPGNKIDLAMDEHGKLLGLSYAMPSDSLLWVIRSDEDHFTPRIQKKRYETRLKSASGTIRGDGSLFLAGRRAGISRAMVAQLVRLLEWDVDFARDVRVGDKFKVVYEAKYYKGRRESQGNILAAEYINQGHATRVIRYTDPSGNTGHYDPKGHSVRKKFIRAPVDFTRISSLFSKQRKHPIFGFTRAHKGVDYAAPRGTPVRASGDGRVTFVGMKGGYGNLVLLQHDDTYTTAYAHLEKFSRGLKVGKRVKQGDVIGQVGSTGNSTGPHLHYEVRVKGEQINPLSAQLPTSRQIPAKYAEDFRFHSARMLAMFKAGDTQLAELSLSRSARKR